VIDFLNNIGRIWAEYFGIAVVQNTIFLGIIYLILSLLRNSTARLKYAVTIIGLIKLLLPPFIPGPLIQGASKNLDTLIGTVSNGAIIDNSYNSIYSTKLVTLPCLLFTLWILIAVITLLISLYSTLRLRLKLKNSEQIHFQNDRVLVNSGIRIFKTDKCMNF